MGVCIVTEMPGAGMGAKMYQPGTALVNTSIRGCVPLAGISPRRCLIINLGSI